MIQRLKHHLIAKSRVKKIREFISLTGAGKDSTILDVGAANKEYSPYDNSLEKIYAYPAKITALSIRDAYQSSINSLASQTNI